MKDNKELLNEIRALDFALWETGLFLNAHKCDEALSYYRSTKEKRDALAEEYEKNYGPLRMMSGAKTDKWLWAKGPWPWECEAN